MIVAMCESTFFSLFAAFRSLDDHLESLILRPVP